LNYERHMVAGEGVAPSDARLMRPSRRSFSMPASSEPGRNRTCVLALRRRPLRPSELQARADPFRARPGRAPARKMFGAGAGRARKSEIDPGAQVGATAKGGSVRRPAVRARVGEMEGQAGLEPATVRLEGGRSLR
jgi:hypothetical protein